MAVSAPTDRRFRRAYVTPAAKRSRMRLWRKRIAYVTVLSAVLLYGAYRVGGFLLSTKALTVTRITISGNTQLSSAEILSRLDGLSGRNMLMISIEEWRQKVLASPWVEDAAIRRVLPGTVDVMIAERHPVGIGRMGNALYLLGQRGGIIDKFGPEYAEFDLPLIDGLATAEHTATGEPVVDESRVALAIRLLASLQGRPDLAERISQIDVADVLDATIILKGETALIRIGDEQFVERLQSYLDLAPALREKVPQIDYVDLRFGERVYVRPLAPGLRVRKAQGGGE